MPQVNSYGRTAALTAKEYQREMLMQMMMTGEEAPPPPEPAQDKRKGMPGRNEGKSAAGPAPASFTADTVDRYHLCGCSPYALPGSDGNRLEPGRGLADSGCGRLCRRGRRKPDPSR